jgi:hypothetical protein
VVRKRKRRRRGRRGRIMGSTRQMVLWLIVAHRREVVRVLGEGVRKGSKQALVTVFGNWMACSISMQDLWFEVTSCST